MKATGIVRRIDDLGRVVIPKEIRRTMRIREGDPLEIYTDGGGEVIFKKYSPIGEIGEFAAQYAESLYKTCGFSVVICDRESVIACAGLPKKDFLKKHLSKELEDVIESRSLYTTGDGKAINVTDGGNDGYFVSCTMPIISEGDITGCVAAVAVKEGVREYVAADTEQKLIQTAATFLGKQLEQ
ncbi:MAG: AbrB/MazE/SpoVT family DNA-binding domain-containing protein [Clostridia bacterium]|nr:AbrB/MazE/SpoVT family DNA-binding domain-containing protein [Clostridia bacterium]